MHPLRGAGQRFPPEDGPSLQQSRQRLLSVEVIRPCPAPEPSRRFPSVSLSADVSRAWHAFQILLVQARLKPDYPEFVLLEPFAPRCIVLGLVGLGVTVTIDLDKQLHLRARTG